MIKVIFAINVTLDGCCDHAKQFADEETHEYFTNLMREVDLLVFGRKTLFKGMKGADRSWLTGQPEGN